MTKTFKELNYGDKIIYNGRARSIKFMDYYSYGNQTPYICLGGKNSDTIDLKSENDLLEVAA